MKSRLGERIELSRHGGVSPGLTCMCRNNNGSLCALGFEDGSIKIYRESSGSLNEMSHFEPFQRAGTFFVS